MNLNTNQIERRPLSLLSIFTDVWKKKIWLILAILLGCGAAFAVSRFLIVPVYHSSIKVYISNQIEPVEKLSESDLETSRALAESCAEVLSGNSLLNMVINKAELKEDSISITVSRKEQVLTISTAASEKQTAFNAASVLEEILPEYSAAIMNGDYLRIISEPQMPRRAVIPDYPLYLAIGGSAGFLLMLFILVIVSVKDQRVKCSRDLTRIFGIPVIGTIPDHPASLLRKDSGEFADEYGEKGE